MNRPGKSKNEAERASVARPPRPAATRVPTAASPSAMKTGTAPGAVQVNVRHLEEHSLRLKGEMTPADLQLETLDELIRVNHPLFYDLEVQKLEHALLVQGRLALVLDCECARCLRSFEKRIEFEHWVGHIPLAGEEKANVVNDLVDLTPYLREDIVLAFPQHPLCKPECGGLALLPKESDKGVGSAEPSLPSPWAALDKLKL